MATTKKRKTTGAARGRKPAKRKTKRVSGPATAPATLTIKGVGRYAKVACGLNKTDANKRAKGLREKGNKARLRKVGTSYCVYKGARRKSAA